MRVKVGHFGWPGRLIAKGQTALEALWWNLNLKDGLARRRSLGLYSLYPQRMRQRANAPTRQRTFKKRFVSTVRFFYVRWRMR